VVAVRGGAEEAPLLRRVTAALRHAAELDPHVQLN
jgi:hypothetical protein